MILERFIKYKDVLIIAILGFVGYKLVDNYPIFLDLLGKLLGILSPFIYALVIAYMLNPIMKMFEKRFKLKRGLAIFATYALVTGIIILFALYIVPGLVDNLISLTSEIPSYIETVQKWIEEFLSHEKINVLMQQSGITDTLLSFTDKVGAILVALLEGTIGSLVSITSSVFKIFLGYLIAIYVLSDKDKLIEESKILLYMIFKEKNGERIIRWGRIYHKMIGIYIGTKALDSLIIGLMALVGLIIIGAPHAALLGLIVGVTNMIPYFGPFVGEVIGAIMGFFVSPLMGILIFVMLLLLQQFDAWYLDPKLVGDRVGVSALFIILAVMIGGGFFGAIGMLLGSPTIATLKILYENKMDRYKKKNEKILNKI